MAPPTLPLPGSLMNHVPVDGCGGLSWYRPVPNPRSEHTWMRLPSSLTSSKLLNDFFYSLLGERGRFALSLLAGFNFNSYRFSIISTWRKNRSCTLHTKIKPRQANNWYNACTKPFH
jgi:hypothetical protein